jgi:hypothetical protein
MMRQRLWAPSSPRPSPLSPALTPSSWKAEGQLKVSHFSKPQQEHSTCGLNTNSEKM